MERLTQKDLDTLFYHLRELYRHRDLESFNSYLLKNISAIVPSKFVSYNEIDLQSTTDAFTLEPTPHNLPEVEEALNAYLDEHPILNYYKKTGDGSAMQISDFLSQREFSRLGFRNEYLGRLGVDRSMAVSLSITPSVLVGVALSRHGKDFSERERLMLDTLRPHLVQAYHNAAAVERNKSELQNLHRAVEEPGGGVISLSRDCKIRLCTVTAKRWLSKYFWPSEREDALPGELRRWVEHQCSLLSGGDSPPRRPLVLERGDERVTIRLVEDGAREGGGHLLLLEERSPLLSSWKLTHSLGLTRRECEVLYLVAQGETDQQVASSLHLSPRTVNKHLQNVYLKLGVSGRAEAVSRALEASGTHRS